MVTASRVAAAAVTVIAPVDPVIVVVVTPTVRVAVRVSGLAPAVSRVRPVKLATPLMAVELTGGSPTPGTVTTMLEVVSTLPNWSSAATVRLNGLPAVIELDG